MAHYYKNCNKTKKKNLPYNAQSVTGATEAAHLNVSFEDAKAIADAYPP